jgi:hypothetical protein
MIEASAHSRVRLELLRYCCRRDAAGGDVIDLYVVATRESPARKTGRPPSRRRLLPRLLRTTCPLAEAGASVRFRGAGNLVPAHPVVSTHFSLKTSGDLPSLLFIENIVVVRVCTTLANDLQLSCWRMKSRLSASAPQPSASCSAACALRRSRSAGALLVQPRRSG